MGLLRGELERVQARLRQAEVRRDRLYSGEQQLTDASSDRSSSCSAGYPCREGEEAGDIGEDDEVGGRQDGAASGGTAVTLDMNDLDGYTRAHWC